MHLFRRSERLLRSKGLVGAPDVLYRNEGDGAFTDVTQASGVAAANRYYGLGVVPADYDSDGDSDLFVANDETPNVLFQNQGDGTFQDIALVAGVAYNGDGDVEAGMGADFGDYDQDGDPDLYVTHFLPRRTRSTATRTACVSPTSRPRPASPRPQSSCWAGERAFRLRQRRSPRPLRRQRPRISAG